MYGIGIYPNAAAANMKIWKKVADIVTELASGDFDITAGDTIKFEVRNASKKLYQNGVERLTTADNELTSAGSGGVGVGSIFISTNDMGINIPSFDNFIITEVTGGGDPEGSLTGGKLIRGGLLRHGVLIGG